jgi:hypothetical protein
MFTCPKRREAALFRVTIHDFAQAFQLQLEGRFTAAEVPEVEARWRTAASIIGNRAFRVDLRAVSDADAAGRSLLGRMHESGAEFIADSPKTTRLVSEIVGVWQAEPAPEEHRGPLQPFRDLPTLLACLFSRLRAWAN